jgi:hypothetical protein
LAIRAGLAEPGFCAVPVAVDCDAPGATGLVAAGVVAQPQASTAQAVNQIRQADMLTNDTPP